ncbi:MAG: HlyD family secretion protein [Verrucomicrobiia bacterium]|jgi:HlyD family secretion protein
MDVARPDIARKKKRRRAVYIVLLVALAAVVTVGLAKLEPAAPGVDEDAVWMDTVKRGEMVRQVRGNGTLVPEKIQFVLGDVAGRIEDILVEPGIAVTTNTVLMILSNPDLVQAVFDAELAVKSSEAQKTQLEVNLETTKLNRQATLAKAKADYEIAEFEAKANEDLYKDGLVSELEAKRLRNRADDLKNRYDIELKGEAMSERTAEAQLAVRDADIVKMKAALAIKKDDVVKLKILAGYEGVLQQIGDSQELEIGQRVGTGTTLAKIVQPDKLKAELKIAETQVKDVVVGQSAEIDTRNGIIKGRVARIDPAVQNGTVMVEVKLEGKLPQGARPDLSVDGAIELDRLDDVLYVGRPVNGAEDSTVGVFKVNKEERTALRVPVKFGRTSVSVIEVVEGLSEGDEVILSDMSNYEEYEKVRLE